MRHAQRDPGRWGHEPAEPRQLATVVPVDVSWLARRYAHGYPAVPYSTIGLEEELILVDAVSLLPVNEIDRVLAVVGGDGRFAAELRACQLELRTPVCVTVADAQRELVAARAHVVDRLDARLRIVAAGTHPASTDRSAVATGERYRRIADEWPWAIRRGQPSGLHVHVGIGGAEEALAVFNAARSYLPELAALAANSPFFEGGESGLASTRLKLTEDLPRAGIPPAFASWRELAEFAAWGLGGGLFADLSYLWWDLRPRPDYGTLEFRVADVQTRFAEAAAIAAACQALVASLAERARRGEQLPVHATHLLSENRSRALRDGLEATLVDPDTGVREPARERIGRLVLELTPCAQELGCAEELEHAWSLLGANGATRQRDVASCEGIHGLLRWLADETEKSPATIAAPVTNHSLANAATTHVAQTIITPLEPAPAVGVPVG